MVWAKFFALLKVAQVYLPAKSPRPKEWDFSRIMSYNKQLSHTSNIPVNKQHGYILLSSKKNCNRLFVTTLHFTLFQKIMQHPLLQRTQKKYLKKSIGQFIALPLRTPLHRICLFKVQTLCLSA